MARTADYSDTQKYSIRKSFDGKPVEPGKVLVPFRQDLMKHPKEVCIEKNFTTMHLGGIKFKIGFMAINESGFAAYMQDFWKSINDELTARSSGRCIIGHNPYETDLFCPHSRRCMGCPKKGLHERRIPNHLDILSLNYEYKNEKFDIEDTSLIPVADQIINTLEPESSVDSGGFFYGTKKKNGSGTQSVYQQFTGTLSTKRRTGHTPFTRSPSRWTTLSRDWIDRHALERFEQLIEGMKQTQGTK